MSDQNQKAVWGRHDQRDDIPKLQMCAEDVEALPEILQAAEDAGKLSVVTDWLQARGHMHSDSGAEIIRPLLDIALASEAGAVRLTLECAALALDLDICTGSRTITAIAKRYGITRQSVDRRFQKICKQLNITDTIVSKSKASRETYKLTNHRHNKNQKGTK